MFARAINNQKTTTTNGMTALVQSNNANVDLFFSIGASRNKDIIPAFVKAFVENAELALRIALWARDVRGGAGERQTFRNILIYLEQNDVASARRLLPHVPEVGRWDDVLVLKGALRNEALAMIKQALDNGNGLCAKWMPRQGMEAVALRTAFNWTPKRWRKTLVELTKVVEQQMCAKDWDNINFGQVPSVASARYKKAFSRNTPKYAEYIERLVNGEEKVNAGAIYPHDVIKGVNDKAYNDVELKHVIAQWEALPNYIGDAKTFPMIDVSGSMQCPAGNNKNLQCIDVAVALGMYIADKNTGVFKDAFLTFHSHPKIQVVKGNIVQKIQQVYRADWGGNTNIEVALLELLKLAVSASVPQSEMPEILLILSDMQFDASDSHYEASMIEELRTIYANAGYIAPKVVFWNLNAYDNVPVRYDEQGVAMVSGFSPSIMKAVLKADMEQFTPEAIMLEAIMVDRYAI
jgi:hypothetical protein